MEVLVKQPFRALRTSVLANPNDHFGCCPVFDSPHAE